MIDYASRRFSEEVTAWPDGSYEADCWVDHDPLGNPDVHLHVTVTVDGDRLRIDFTGSDTRPELQAWSTYGNTRGYTVAQIAAMMDPEIPKNEGFFESIDLVVPQGCVLNPAANRPVSAGTHHPGADVGEVIALALQYVLPHKAVPQVYKTGIPTVITGTDPRTGPTVHRPLGRGLRRLVQRGEGHGRLGLPGRRLRQPLEGHRRDQREPVPARAVEPRLPHRLGRARVSGAGLCGSHYVKEVRTDAKVYTYVVGMKYPMPGIAGGRPGAPNQLTIRYGSDDPYVVAHTADWVPIAAGQRICYDYGGGGGWGDPLDRDPQAVLDDVLDEYVSVEGRGARLRRGAHRLAGRPDPGVDADATTAEPSRMAADPARRVPATRARRQPVTST